MKKVILTTLCAAALSTGAFGQGLVNFLNNASTLVTLSSNSVNLGSTPAGVPGSFSYELFRAPAGTVVDVGFVASGLTGTNLTTAGRFNGGNGRAIPGTALGGTTAILVRGWSSNLGSTWAAAVANQGIIGGYFGSSAIAPNFLLGGDGGNGNVPTSPMFGGTSGIQSGFALTYVDVVPEPSSMALAGIGAASLLIFRRRK